MIIKIDIRPLSGCIELPKDNYEIGIAESHEFVANSLKSGTFDDDQLAALKNHTNACDSEMLNGML